MNANLAGFGLIDIYRKLIRVWDMWSVWLIWRTRYHSSCTCKESNWIQVYIRKQPTISRWPTESI